MEKSKQDARSPTSIEAMESVVLIDAFGRCIRTNLFTVLYNHVVTGLKIE